MKNEVLSISDICTIQFSGLIIHICIHQIVLIAVGNINKVLYVYAGYLIAMSGYVKINHMRCEKCATRRGRRL